MNSSNLYYRPVFTYSENGIPEMVKRLAENEFVDARNEAIELLNPHYKEWNAEYGKEIEGEDDMKYLAFIQSKQNEILEQFNKTWTGALRLWADEYADIYGVFKIFDKKVKMHMSIKPFKID